MAPDVQHTQMILTPYMYMFEETVYLISISASRAVYNTCIYIYNFYIHVYIFAIDTEAGTGLGADT